MAVVRKLKKLFRSPVQFFKDASRNRREQNAAAATPAVVTTPATAAKPAIATTPAAAAKPAAAVKPAVATPAAAAKPAAVVKPAVASKPAAVVKPAVTAKPATPSVHEKMALSSEEIKNNKYQLPLCLLHDGKFNLWFAIRFLMTIRMAQIGLKQGPLNKQELTNVKLFTTYLDKVAQDNFKKLGALRAADIDEAQKCDFLFVTNQGGSDLVRTKGNYHVSRIFEPYMEAASQVGSTLRLEFLKSKKMPASYDGRTIFLMQNEKRIERHWEKVYQANLFEQFCEKIPSLQLTPAFLFYTIDEFYNCFYLFLEVLKKLRPKVVFSTPFYYNLYLNAACRELGIKSVELQHGNIIGSPGIFHAHVEEQEIVGTDLLPTDFFVYSERDRLYLEEMFPEAEVHDFGYLWTEYAEKIFDTRQYARLGQKIAKKTKDFSLTVLVTTSGMELDALLAAIIVSPEAQKRNICFIVRSKEKFAARLQLPALPPWVLYDHMLFNIPPLPVILEHVDVHLTVNSSSVYEADAAGVELNFVCGEAGDNNYVDLIDDEILYHVTKPETFYAQLDDLLLKKVQAGESAVGNRFEDCHDQLNAYVVEQIDRVKEEVNRQLGYFCSELNNIVASAEAAKAGETSAGEAVATEADQVDADEAKERQFARFCGDLAQEIVGELASDAAGHEDRRLEASPGNLAKAFMVNLNDDGTEETVTRLKNFQAGLIREIAEKKRMSEAKESLFLSDLYELASPGIWQKIKECESRSGWRIKEFYVDLKEHLLKKSAANPRLKGFYEKLAQDIDREMAANEKKGAEVEKLYAALDKKRLGRNKYRFATPPAPARFKDWLASHL